MGHLRLSILDLDDRSNQPMERDGTYIVYNGEIYNFLSLKEELLKLGYNFRTTSDTEVLLLGYRHWGAEVLQKINGMFSFAIYDSLNELIFCARDRLGVKPFYYYWKDGQFEIASQLRPLLNGTSKISEEAISIYLDCGYVPSPYSIVENVCKLAPGNFMEIDLVNGSKRIEGFWDLEAVLVKDISYEDAKKELHALLTDAIKIRLKADVPLGMFLSGGIDSALISSIASKISPDPIHTFTIGFEDPKFDESKVAAAFADIIGSIHTETIFKAKEVLDLIPKLVYVYDEPFADSSALPSLLLNSVTKKNVTVALSGDGGDESFFGYNHFDSVNNFLKLQTIPFSIRKILSKVFSFSFFAHQLPHFQSVFSIRVIRDFIEAIFIGYESLQKVRRKKWLSIYRKYLTLSPYSLQKAADLNIKLWLENDSNVKVDRASMAYAVEIRSPFLDYRIIEYARSIPVSYRYQKNRKKKILRDILSEYIPARLFDQPKKGFSIPLGQWMRNELKEEMISNLQDDFLNLVPNLDVLKFKNMLHDHFEGKCDHTISVWRIYILSKWYQEFGFY